MRTSNFIRVITQRAFASFTTYQPKPYQGKSYDEVRAFK